MVTQNRRTASRCSSQSISIQIVENDVSVRIANPWFYIDFDYKLNSVDYTEEGVIPSQLWQPSCFAAQEGSFNDGHQVPIIYSGHHIAPVRFQCVLSRFRQIWQSKIRKFWVWQSQVWHGKLNEHGSFCGINVTWYFGTWLTYHVFANLIVK